MQKSKLKLAFDVVLFLVGVVGVIYSLPGIISIFGIGKDNTAEYLIPNGNVVVAFNNRVIAYQAIPGGTLRRTFRSIGPSGLEDYWLGVVKHDDDGVYEEAHDSYLSRYPTKAGNRDGITLSTGFVDVGNKIKFHDRNYECLTVMDSNYSSMSTYCKGVGYFGYWTDEGKPVGLTTPHGVVSDLSSGDFEANVAGGVAAMLIFGKWERLKPIGDSNAILRVYGKLFEGFKSSGVRPVSAAILSVCLMARDPSAIDINYEKNLPFCWGQVEKYANKEKRWADYMRKEKPTLMDDATYNVAVGFIK